MFEQNEWARNDRAIPDPFEIYDKLLDLQEDLKKCQRDLEEHKRISELRFSSLERWQDTLARRPCTTDSLGSALSFILILALGAFLSAAGMMLADKKFDRTDRTSDYKAILEQSPLPPPPKNPFPEAVRVIPEREEVQYQYSDKTLEVKSLKQVDNNEEK